MESIKGLLNKANPSVQKPPSIEEKAKEDFWKQLDYLEKGLDSHHSEKVFQ
jgi:hypothetical protein